MKNKPPHFSSRRPIHCPACESKQTAQILYGIPTAEVLPKVESGEIVLGACSSTNLDPTWECTDCHTQIYSETLRGKYEEFPDLFIS